jgi:hypothetical protein
VLGAVAFWILLISAGLLICINGPAVARRFLGLIILASIGTAAVDLLVSAALAPYAYLTIDGLLLIAAVIYVLKERVFWPMWFAGFQMIAVVSHSARLILSGPIPAMYAQLAGFWAVPALISMAIGTVMDRRAGLAA